MREIFGETHTSSRRTIPPPMTTPGATTGDIARGQSATRPAPAVEETLFPRYLTEASQALAPPVPPVPTSLTPPGGLTPAQLAAQEAGENDLTAFLRNATASFNRQASSSMNMAHMVPLAPGAMGTLGLQPLSERPRGDDHTRDMRRVDPAIGTQGGMSVND